MPVSGPPSFPTRPPRRWWPWLLGSVALLLVAGLLVVLLWPRGDHGSGSSSSHPTAPIATPAQAVSLPPAATSRTVAELNLPAELAGWQRVASEPRRGAVARLDRYARDGETLTISAIAADTLAHATAGVPDPVDGASFRCSSTSPQRCWAQAADGVVALNAPAGVDAAALMGQLVAQLG